MSTQKFPLAATLLAAWESDIVALQKVVVETERYRWVLEGIEMSGAFVGRDCEVSHGS